MGNKVDETRECPVCKGSGRNPKETERYEEKTGTWADFECLYCAGVGTTRMINLTTAQELLGKNTVVCLEPDNIISDKIDSGKYPELWGFNVATAISGRGDNKFFDVRLIDRGGYHQLAIYEEPGVETKIGEIRVVGEIIIEISEGIIVARKANGLNGPIYELKPSSISKGELAPENQKPIAFIESNPQRIMGLMAVYIVEREEPPIPDKEKGEKLMAFEKFCRLKTDDGRQDGRSLAAAYVASNYIP